MNSLDKSRLESKIKASLGVQHIRVQIEQAEAELERAHTALRDLPASLRYDLLERQEQALEALLQREQKLLAQARKTAEGELRAEQVENLRMEAAPLLQRCAKALDIVRHELIKVARIEAEARANGGSVMSERFDKGSIEFFVPQLTHDQSRGTWTLKR